EPDATNEDDQANYSHAIVRRLGAEQLHDALFQFARVRPEFASFPEVTRAVALPGPVRRRRSEGGLGASDLFLRQFGQPPRLLACECERSNETAMGQAFALISSPQIDDIIRRQDNIIGDLLDASLTDWDRIRELFWRALSRAPTADELSKLSATLTDASGEKRRAAMEDIVWTLVNAKEFVLRR
ncbi:MAG TPA: DUF1553 domain-containing protein, partial [Verrucomicrobiaceae bacterium]